MIKVMEEEFDIYDLRTVALLDIIFEGNINGLEYSWMREAAFWITFELTCNKGNDGLVNFIKKYA